jgi:hypothetical protein
MLMSYEGIEVTTATDNVLEVTFQKIVIFVFLCGQNYSDRPDDAV